VDLPVVPFGVALQELTQLSVLRILGGVVGVPYVGVAVGE
jgi:hypothetical protein